LYLCKRWVGRRFSIGPPLLFLVQATPLTPHALALPFSGSQLPTDRFRQTPQGVQPPPGHGPGCVPHPATPAAPVNSSPQSGPPTNSFHDHREHRSGQVRSPAARPFFPPCAPTILENFLFRPQSLDALPLPPARPLSHVLRRALESRASSQTNICVARDLAPSPIARLLTFPFPEITFRFFLYLYYLRGGCLDLTFPPPTGPPRLALFSPPPPPL